MVWIGISIRGKIMIENCPEVLCSWINERSQVARQEKYFALKTIP